MILFSILLVAIVANIVLLICVANIASESPLWTIFSANIMKFAYTIITITGISTIANMIYPSFEFSIVSLFGMISMTILMTFNYEAIYKTIRNIK